MVFSMVFSARPGVCGGGCQKILTPHPVTRIAGQGDLRTGR